MVVNAAATKTVHHATAIKMVLAATVVRNANAIKTVLAVVATKPQMRQKPKTAPQNIRTKTARITQSITPNNYSHARFHWEMTCIA